MTLVKNKDLGFDKDQVVNVKLYGLLWHKTFTETPVIKNEFLKNPNILAVGRVGNMIGENLSVEAVVPVGKEQEADKYSSVRVMRIDEDYLNVIGATVLKGRNFSTKFNDSSSFIINESAVKALRLEDPIGKRINNLTMNLTGTIVGVVKDYHFASLHSQIEPLVMECRPEWTGWLTVKLGAGKTQEALEYIKHTVDGIAPGSLFVYDFLDDRLNMLYKSEDSMGKVFQFFSALAIIIGCLGLLGLSAYTVERKTKEIGIRKVLGSTVVGIVKMVSSKFFILVFIGLTISIPLTWYGMSLWLHNFAYQITIEWWVFALTAGVILVITVFVISFHTVSAALQNPVRALRYE
jgi:putative ABC transport system permease protein